MSEFILLNKGKLLIRKIIIDYVNDNQGCKDGFNSALGFYKDGMLGIIETASEVSELLNSDVDLPQ